MIRLYAYDIWHSILDVPYIAQSQLKTREESRQDATELMDSLRKTAGHREERKTARAVQATKGNEKGMKTFKDNEHYHQSARLYDEGKGSMRYDNAKRLEKGEHEDQQ